VAAIAHRFKGACSNTGANALSQRIAQLGKAAHAGDLAAVAEQYDALTKNWAEFVAALADLDWGNP
jgi:HPt (histidine-containing phosphotransfer) domain-containing protein